MEKDLELKGSISLNGASIHEDEKKKWKFKSASLPRKAESEEQFKEWIKYVRIATGDNATA